MGEKTLQEQMQRVKEQIRAEQAKGAEANPVVLAQLEREEAEILAQLEQEKQAAIEDKVQSEGIPFAVSGINFAGLPPEVITLIEQVVQADRRRMLNEHAVELEHLENDFAAYKEETSLEIAAMNKELAELEADYDKCNQELREKRDDNLRLIGERDEANKGRDNAAAQLAEAQKEIKRLESQIDDYQKAQIHGEREAQKIIDVTPDETNSIAAAVEAVRKLVNPSTEEKAAFALDAFAKRNPELIAPELQVSPFRGSESTGDQLPDDDTAASSDQVQPEVAFQDTTESELPAVEVPIVGQGAGEDDQGAVSRYEFEALKADVEELKVRIGKAAA